MIVDFLKSYEDELLGEKTDIELSLEAVRTRLLESEKFLDVIKEESAEAFTDFTPRNINSKNKERIDETEAEIADYTKQIAAMEQRLSGIEDRLKQTRDAIHEAASFTTRSAKHVSIPKDDLLNIISYILSDPMRAKIELEQFM